MPSDAFARSLILVLVAAPLGAAASALAQDAPSLVGQPTPATPIGGGGATPAGGAPAAGGDPTFLYLMFGLIILWFVILIFGQRREAKRKAGMIDSLKKHDRVQTAGGVIGSIVEVKPDTVVLKVDESSNTRITFTKSAVVGVIKEAASEPAKDSQKAS
jgi:preprotein translocase subunit YajC